MTKEQSYTVTLKVSISDTGAFESVRLLKGRSQLPDHLLLAINNGLKSSLIPSEPIRTTVAIGNDAETMLMNCLQRVSKVNQGFSVRDTSSETGHGDMSVDYQGFRICVESKNYKSPVPMKEIDKYHKSLALTEYSAGIIFQSDLCGYAREAGILSPIDLRFVEGKPSAYLTDCDPDLIYPIINMIVAMLKASTPIDPNELDNKRKALLAIHERVSDLRLCIDAQKKALAKMETAVESIASLSA